MLQVSNLSLVQRVNIALDMASALEYLHHGCEVPIVHRDLKPSNILLDSDKVAHVGDFGLAKFLPQPPNPNQSTSTGVKGTIGYAPPGIFCLLLPNSNNLQPARWVSVSHFLSFSLEFGKTDIVGYELLLHLDT